MPVCLKAENQRDYPVRTGSDRTQLEMVSLEELIEADNSVRFVDAFVDKLDLKALGIGLKELKNEGHPAFHPNLLLKLYFFGV
jgi:hypothetical protein